MAMSSQQMMSGSVARASNGTAALTRLCHGALREPAAVIGGKKIWMPGPSSRNS
jgi:hypothetical protein